MSETRSRPGQTANELLKNAVPNLIELRLVEMERELDGGDIYYDARLNLVAYFFNYTYRLAQDCYHI